MKAACFLLMVLVFIASCDYKRKPIDKEENSMFGIAKDTSYSYFKYKDTLVDLGEARNIENYQVISKKEAFKIDPNKVHVVFHFRDSVLVNKPHEFSYYHIYKKFKPKFKYSDFMVSEIYKGKLAKPLINSCTGSYEYRTRIEDGCRDLGVNFAGHYTIVEWGCGTECVDIAIVDRITGQIYMGFSFQNSNTDYDEAVDGVTYQKDSKLLLINSGLVDVIPGYESVNDYIKPEFYEWTGTDLKKLN